MTDVCRRNPSPFASYLPPSPAFRRTRGGDDANTGFMRDRAVMGDIRRQAQTAQENYESWPLMQSEFPSTGGNGIIIKGYDPVIVNGKCVTDFSAHTPDGKAYYNVVEFEIVDVPAASSAPTASGARRTARRPAPRPIASSSRMACGAAHLENWRLKSFPRRAGRVETGLRARLRENFRSRGSPAARRPFPSSAFRRSGAAI